MGCARMGSAFFQTRELHAFSHCRALPGRDGATRQDHSSRPRPWMARLQKIFIRSRLHGR